MGLYEVVLRQTYFTSAVINRWNYLSSGGAGSALPAFGLMNALGFLPTAATFPAGTLAGEMQSDLSLSLIFVSAQIRNVYDPRDFFEQFWAATVHGNEGSDPSAPFVAAGFVSTQTTLAISKGHKRLAGVPESYTDAGGILSSSGLSNLSVVAERMSDIVTYAEDGASLAFAPTIVGKEKYESHADPVRFSYRYFPTEAEQLAHVASPVVWSVDGEVRSQVSRQYGRGI